MKVSRDFRKLSRMEEKRYVTLKVVKNERKVSRDLQELSN